MYLRDLQVNPYTTILDGGQQMDVWSPIIHIEIMIDP
jgi:hypothetical protein